MLRLQIFNAVSLSFDRCRPVGLAINIDELIACHKLIVTDLDIAKMQLIDWAVEDASFLRLQTVTLGYTLPKSLVKKFHIENVRIYGTGYNLLCFTKYEGYDPEVDTSSKKNPMTPGIDYAAYPKSRTYVIGINVTF